MITKPPPYESAPTLNATQAEREQRPPLAAPAASSGSIGTTPRGAGRDVRRADDELDRAAAEQDDDEPRPDRGRGSAARTT